MDAGTTIDTSESGAHEFTYPIRIGLYCDREDWILGTIAKQISRVHGNSKLFRFEISSWQQFMERPLDQIRAFRKCDIIHWISPDGYRQFRGLFNSQAHICTIHHCMPGDKHHPSEYDNTPIITVSENSRRELENRGFRDITVIHNGVDSSVFQPADQSRCRAMLGIDPEIPLIGFFAKESSNPQDRKGTRILIETVELLARSQKIGILISGDGWERLTRELESVGGIVYRRSVDDISDMQSLYGAIDLYLCVSRVEGGPVPVIEAMVCGRPIVTTPVGQVPELIEDGENGIVVPIDNVAATADAVNQVLSTPGLGTRLGASARATIVNDWTWDKVLVPVADTYKGILGNYEFGHCSKRDVIQTYILLFLKSIRNRMRSANLSRPTQN